LGGIQEEIAGFGKSIERQEVGGCLQVGGTWSEIPQPAQKVATLLAVREIRLEIIERLRWSSRTMIDDLDTGRAEGTDHLRGIDDIPGEGQLCEKHGKDALKGTLGQLRLHFTCDEVSRKEGGVECLVEILQGDAERRGVECFGWREISDRL
jgi:hypothetical protein